MYKIMFENIYSSFVVHCSIFILLFAANFRFGCGDDCLQRCSSELISLNALCGSDHKLYRNECQLKCAKVTQIQCNKCLIEKWKREKSNESNENEFECNEKDADYLMIQCHLQTSYCWCVNLFNGKPIPGTSLKNKKPNCVKFLKQLKRKRRPRRGEEINHNKCTNDDEHIFSRNLINIFISELKRIKQQQQQQQVTHQQQQQQQSMNISKVESVEWKFTDLDTNKDSTLSRKELKHFKRMIIKIIRPTKCSHQFIRICDANKDKFIDLNEWKTCLHQQPSIHLSNSNKKPKRKQTPLDMVLMLTNSGAGNSGFGGGGGGIPFLLPSRNKDETEDDDDDNDMIIDEKSNKGVVLSENCSASRKNGLERLISSSSTIFVPECQSTNSILYNEVQCHQATRYCWCVDIKNGHPIPHTSSSNLQRPNCKERKSSNQSIIKGCLFRKKQRFVRELIHLFENEMKTNQTKIESGNNLATIKWKFNQLDLNGNSKLERSEVKTFKQIVAQLKQMKNLRKCWRNFFRFCDLDSNQYLDENEWIQCCGENDYNQQQHQQQQQQQRINYDSINAQTNKRRMNPFTNKRRGPNPFSSILKAD